MLWNVVAFTESAFLPPWQRLLSVPILRSSSVGESQQATNQPARRKSRLHKHSRQEHSTSTKPTPLKPPHPTSRYPPSRPPPPSTSPYTSPPKHSYHPRAPPHTFSTSPSLLSPSAAAQSPYLLDAPCNYSAPLVPPAYRSQIGCRTLRSYNQ